MLKGKDFINEKKVEENEDCVLYEVHAQAFEKFDSKMLCPNCGAEIDTNTLFQTIIGETNSCEIDKLKEETFYLAPVCICPKCHSVIALIPTVVDWNGNHDVYYTGGKNLTPGLDINKFDMSEIDANIKEYTDRIKKGENLKPWQLSQWTKYAIEKIISEELYKRGLKI